MTMQFIGSIWRVPGCRRLLLRAHTCVCAATNYHQRLRNYCHRYLLRTFRYSTSVCQNNRYLGIQSYGPLFPFAEYTLMNSLLTSLACYIAIGVVVIIFIFPESLNHAVLTSTSGLLSKVKSLIDMQEDVLNAPISDLVGDGAVLTRVTGARVAIVAGLQGCKALHSHV